ncbi:MAG: helix-hairpin-helix domain-containing protein [Candidatus Brocadiaceae bacterium]|jgi:hypothetical protein
MDNDEIAEMLDRVAGLLEAEEENPYRVRSYRRAAGVVRDAERPVADLLAEKGVEGLQDLPGIGEKLAGAIREMVRSGRLGLLEQLEARVSPESVLARVPGVGETLATRVHDELGIETLEELEVAAHDGRLAEVEGMGEERLQGIRDALAGMLGRSAARGARRRTEGEQRAEEPPVELILQIDREYRERAEAGELRKIAPRRFNPEGEAWLPIMHTSREGWDFTVLFSNTARAHELHKTDDWVVVYYENGGGERQCTVITAESGPLSGKRIVAGRERECRSHYEEGGG